VPVDTGIFNVLKITKEANTADLDDIALDHGIMMIID
jgi:hypothetical protein